VALSPFWLHSLGPTTTATTTTTKAAIISEDHPDHFTYVFLFLDKLVLPLSIYSAHITGLAVSVAI